MATPGRRRRRRELVTGAASGIGAETVRRFKEEGATVVGIDLHDGSSGVDMGLACDVADEDAVRRMFEAVRAEFDSIDVLFNNAGISGQPSALTADGYELVFGTNHIAHQYLTLLLMPKDYTPSYRRSLTSDLLSFWMAPSSASWPYFLGDHIF